MILKNVIFRQLGVCNYQDILQKMKIFTENRHSKTKDECWLLEHPAVFTQGYRGDNSHLLNPGSIPVIQSDRGGQVTYHGPGQLILYPLLDLRRLKIGPKRLVHLLEASTIQLLKTYHIQAYSSQNAPGVYVNSAKIASIGLRIRKGCSYHGLALNINMDLTPFSFIQPCGIKNLNVTQLNEFIPSPNKREIGEKLFHDFITLE